ncbi:DUF1385 domain-containing protein [Caldanaerobius polysaccharolyticus]|uniref:DUF1385 domain-containing protein n=1 Tax=Caldanaerobius polysaccharolyticus TaxID=44256 RepID=UPI00068E44AE|nr:DUF1385 domain-containing protein [Caldanaerobius polysaccharolyticus]
MMRGKNGYAVAVRKQDGSISIFKQPSLPITKRAPILNVPFLRGTFVLFDSLYVGIKALMYSADVVEENNDGPKEKSLKDSIMMMASLFLSMVFAVLLFFILPTYVSSFLKVIVPSSAGLNVMEGVLRVVIFLIYLSLISMMRDIQRVFQYHGAEHKVIHCLEHGEELTVENARKYSTLHPRCGTNFLFVVMIVSIIVFSVFQWPSLQARIVLRIVLLPVVAGISYEFIKLAGRSDNRIVKWLTALGLYLQKFTTREPDDSQLEVAICSLKGVLDEGKTVECP